MARGINVLLTLKDRFSAPLRSVAGGTRDMQRQFKQANTTINNFGNGFKSQVNGLISSVASFGSALGAMTVGAFVFDAVNTYKDFDQAMKNTAATAGITADRSNADYKRMEDAAREMGKKTSKTAAEAANALNYMSLAGWSVDDSLKGLEPVLRLSEASGMDLAQCSDAVTDSLSALGLTANDLPRYLDVVSRAQQKSNMTASMLMEAYKTCGGVMKNLNITTEESSTALGVLANRGIKGAEGGNALSSIMANLTAGTGAAGKELEKIGVSAFDSDGKFIGLQNTLLKLNEATKNMTDKEKSATFAAIGGKEQIDTLNALMQGLTTTTKDGRTEWNALSDELTNNADGALNKMADTMNDTLGGAMSRFRSAIEDMQLSLMDAFGPSIKNMLDDLASNLLPKISNEFAYFGKNILPAIAGQMGTIVPLFGGIASGLASFAIISKVSAMFKTFGMVTEGVSAAGGVFNFVMAMNPIALWAIGIGAAIAGIILLWNKCEGFRTFVLGFWEVIKAFAIKISESLAPVFAVIKEKLAALTPKIDEIAKAFLVLWNEYLSPLISWLGEIFMPIFDLLGAFIGGFFIGWLKNAGNTISGLISLFTGIIDFLMGVFTGNWGKAWEGIKGVFTGIIEIIENTFFGFIKSIGAGLSALFDKAKQALSLGKGSKENSGGENISVPRNATGTSYFGGGMTSINENGGEIVNLPSGTQIIPHDVSKQATNSNQPKIEIHFNIAGNVIGNEQFMNECGRHVTGRVIAALGNM